MFKKLMPVILALTALPVGATTTFYYTGASVNTEAAFDTATGVLIDYTFTGETLTSPDFYSLLDAGPTGVDFFAFSNNNLTPVALTIVSSTLRNTTANSGSNGSTLRVDLPTDVRAIGLHLTALTTGNFCFEAPGTTACGHTSEGQIQITGGSTYFFGIISDAAIDSFQIRTRTTNSFLAVQNFAVGLEGGGGGEVPEPSTMALLGSSLIALPFLARRKRRQ
jgi:hypothetical protein